MDHNIAHETYAAERYLLGEMQPDERNDFEDHYFGCRLCGEEVQTASLFMENAKQVFRDDSLGIGTARQRSTRKTAEKTDGWSKPAWLRFPVLIPSMAALLLAGVVGYQNMVVIPGLLVPRSMASPLVLEADTRSAALPGLAADLPLRFQVVLLRNAQSDPVLVQVLDAKGKVLKGGILTGPENEKPLEVYFPGRLAAGRYTLLVQIARGASAGQELARHQFQITPSGE